MYAAAPNISSLLPKIPLFSKFGCAFSKEMNMVCNVY